MMIQKLAASLFLLAALPTSMSAEDCCMPEYTPGDPLCDACAGYSEYAGIELDCGWDLFAYGEFIYWRPVPNVSFVSEEIPLNTFQQPQTMLPFTYGYRPGFRVGLGMVAHCFDNWIFNIDYFRYHQAFSKTMTTNFPNVLVSLLGIGTVASAIRNHSLFHYDIIGLNMQRPNYLGQRVILSPFFGLKWLKRNVEFSQNLIDFAEGSNRFRSTLKYTSIGLAAGLEGSWLLCWGLRLIGTADVALLYAYDRSLHQVITPAIIIPGVSPVVITKQHIKHLDIYAKGGLGIGWGSYLCCRRYHVNLGVTFDFMDDVVKLDDFSGGIGNGTIALMGLSVRGQFDF